ncbi:MAG: putative copper resistance protein [Pseudomonadota bacterium]|jgi:CopA family copper-resistance protein
MPTELHDRFNLKRPTRRRFVQGLAGVGIAGLLRHSPAYAESAVPGISSGDRFDLEVGALPVNLTGRTSVATLVNGMLPAPTLRCREGDTVTINVANRLDEDTSIHWHGILLPAAMDGVPGLTFAGIKPRENFTYRFPLKQAGTYWYHSHSGMQEQTGLYGAFIVAPSGPDPHAFDSEHVIVLSDWTDEDPMTVVANLKQESHYYNYQQRTLGTFFEDAERDGFSAALQDRLMWGTMRMSPTDIMDVTGATYTFLVNGKPPAANWTGLFRPGERVRLRVINASAMTTFDVRIPGLDLQVVQADGMDVEAVTVEEFRIGVAETYDVIVRPRDAAYTVFAQAQDRSGYARATLAPRPGMVAPIPSLDPRPLRSMADMGMDHGAHGAMPAVHAGHAVNPAFTPEDPHRMQVIDHGGETPAAMDHAMGHTGHETTASTSVENADGIDPENLAGQPNVDNYASTPMNRLHEAGAGLDGNGRKVLTYADLRSLSATSAAPPTRIIEFHLTGNMHRFVWGFNGRKFSESAPIHLQLDERVRFVLVNNTMMEHPIHLHGFFGALENGQGDRLPLKHTINVKPNERLTYLFTADTPGHWAFHCHLLYHMEAGMFRTIVVS